MDQDQVEVMKVRDKDIKAKLMDSIITFKQ